jgi:hypothetical protein
MIYLAMHKKGGKNAHGIFVTLSTPTELEKLTQDFEKSLRCPHQGMFIDCKNLYAVPCITEGVAYYIGLLQPETITLLAEPTVNNKKIKQATAFLKDKYTECQVSLLRLLPLRNWYPTYPSKMSEKQKLSEHAKRVVVVGQKTENSKQN